MNKLFFSSLNLNLSRHEAWLNIGNCFTQKNPFLSSLQVETSAYSALLLARLLLNRKHFSWIERRINFPIKMQASGFATQPSNMYSESYKLYKSSRYSTIDGESEADKIYANKWNITRRDRLDRSTDWKRRNIVFGHADTNDCVFTRVNSNCIAPQFRTVDITSHKRTSNRRLNKLYKQSATRYGLLVHRRAVLDDQFTGKDRNASGWT